MRRTILAVILLVLVTAGCKSTPPETETPVVPSATPTVDGFHSTPRFQVFIINSLKTCLVGNEFASGNVCAGTACGDCNCGWEDHDPPAPQMGVPPERVGEAQYAGYAHHTCLDITLTEEEVQDIIADMEVVREQVYAWTGGALDLQMEYTVLSHAYSGFTAPEFVIGPFEIDDDLLDAYVSSETDFVYVVTGVQDREQGLQLAHWCGSSYGEYSIRGSTYSYIQYNHEVCNSVSIGGETVYEPLIHEWMHSMDWALYYVNRAVDLYQNKGPDWGTWQRTDWPACGTGSEDPTDWFPSIDFCEWDPDWLDCNNTASAGRCIHAGEVEGEVSWYEHVITEHYPREVEFIGNFCRDGRQDFSETGVDSGGPCK